MKVNLKEKLKKKEKNKEGKKRVFSLKKQKSAAPEEDGGFEAMVYSSKPILKVQKAKKQAAWKNGLLANIACALLVMAVISLFCMGADYPEMIPYTLACLPVFMTVAILREVKPGRARWIAAAVFAVILAAAAIIWRGAIFGGLGSIINWFYDTAELAQAYIYDRLPESETATGEAGVAWLSAAAGLIASLPPAKARRGVSALIAIAAMLAFAYYGVIPSAVCVAVMIAVLIAAVSRGSVLSFVPVMLVALLIFGAVNLIDPGESYGVSRMNENFRDRFALKSALLENDGSLYDDPFDDSFENEPQNEDEEYADDSEETPVEYAAYGLIAIAVAALGAAAFLIYRNLKKRRALIRKGIDSKDAREAVTAMFPYAVRWLKGYGIEQPDASFASMEPALKKDFSDAYAKLFMDMYKSWSEAAYSDHPVSEKTRLLMEAFTKDTAEQVKKKSKLMDKLKLRFKYAL